MSNQTPDDGLSPREVEEMRELGRRGILPSIEQTAKEFTAPFYWYNPDQTAGSRIVGGGTICFLETPDRLLGVSAAHIHRECMKAVTTNPWFGCQIGGHTFRPDKRIIDIDDHADLVTYDLSEVQVAAAKAYAYSPAEWPPLAHEPLQYAMAGGWPWRLTAEADGSSTHHFLHFIGRFNLKSTSNVGMATFRSGSLPWGTTVLPRGLNIGGMSGGPVYSVSFESLLPLRMIGIIYEFGQNTEQVLARPLSQINGDGTINR